VTRDVIAVPARPPGRPRRDGLAPGSPEAKAADKAKRRVQQRARRAAERAAEEESQRTPRSINLAYEPAYLSLEKTGLVLRAATGRVWHVSEVLKLVEDNEVIVTDSTPPRVFKVTLERYMRRSLSPRMDAGGERDSVEDDSPDLGPGILIRELFRR
jgi:hypothetical protein